jgi:hypothetical protein
MPVFDYKCKKCNTEKTDVLVRTPSDIPICCGVSMIKRAGFPRIYIFPQEGIHLKHVSKAGKTFFSKKEMRDYAKANNLILGALE